MCVSTYTHFCLPNRIIIGAHVLVHVVSSHHRRLHSVSIMISDRGYVSFILGKWITLCCQWCLPSSVRYSCGCCDYCDRLEHRSLIEAHWSLTEEEQIANVLALSKQDCSLHKHQKWVYLFCHASEHTINTSYSLLPTELEAFSHSHTHLMMYCISHRLLFQHNSHCLPQPIIRVYNEAVHDDIGHHPVQ